MLGGRFEKLYWMLKTLDNVKYYRKVELIKILRNERVGDYLRKAFLLIAKVLDDNIRESKAKLKEMRLSERTEAFKGIQSKICRSWEDMAKDEKEFEQKYGKYALTKCIPENESSIRKSLKKRNREPGMLGDLEKEDVYLTLLTSLMGGDIHLFLNIMTNYSVDPENMTDADNQIIRTADLARSTFKMMKMSSGRFMGEMKRTFKEELGLEEEVDEEEEDEHEEGEEPETKAREEGKEEVKKEEKKENKGSEDIMEFARLLSALNV